MIFDKYKERGPYHYDWYEMDKDYKECVDAVVSRVNGSVIDIGSGDGLLEAKISEMKPFAEILGIDSSIEGHELAKEKAPRANYILADVDTFRTTLSFDTLICLNTIEHMEHPENLLEIIKDSVRINALIITDYPGKEKGKYHTKEFSRHELSQFFIAAGFKVQDLQLESNQYHGVEVLV